MDIGKWSMVIPWFLSLATAAIGIWQFGVQQRQANRRPFLEQQLTTCIEATDVASRLATETDPLEWEKQRTAFWRLYWGRLALVEDRDVEECMVQFGVALHARLVSDTPLPATELQILSLSLAHAARNLILHSWNIKLEPLRGEEVKDNTIDLNPIAGHLKVPSG